MSELQPTPEQETIEQKKLSLGVEVKTLRKSSGKIEGGWKVIALGIDFELPDGSTLPAVMIEKKDEVSGEVSRKPVAVEGLLALNPELKVSNPESEHEEAREDLAEEALEAVGLEDPSEINENAQMFSKDEISAMRDASRRVVETEPTTPTNSYDHLFSADYTGGSVEEAAVPETEEERLTRERRNADQADAAIKRAGRSEMN